MNPIHLPTTGRETFVWQDPSEPLIWHIEFHEDSDCVGTDVAFTQAAARTVVDAALRYPHYAAWSQRETA